MSERAGAGYEGAEVSARGWRATERFHERKTFGCRCCPEQWRRAWRRLVRDQRRLDPTAERILRENLWEMYE